MRKLISKIFPAALLVMAKGLTAFYGEMFSALELVASLLAAAALVWGDWVEVKLLPLELVFLPSPVRTRLLAAKEGQNRERITLILHESRFQSEAAESLSDWLDRTSVSNVARVLRKSRLIGGKS